MLSFIKGAYKHLTVISLLFILVACSADKENTTPQGGDDTFNLLDENQDFSLSLPWVSNKLALSNNHKESISTYLRKIFKKKGFEYLDNVEVLLAFDSDNGAITNPIITLVGMGYKEGQQFPVAREFYRQSLVKAGGGIGGGPMDAGEVHSCEGKPCSCCSLIKEQYWVGPFLNSRITGCKCNQGPASENCPGEEGTCNHTVSTAP